MKEPGKRHLRTSYVTVFERRDPADPVPYTVSTDSEFRMRVAKNNVIRNHSHEFKSYRSFREDTFVEVTETDSDEIKQTTTKKGNKSAL